MNRSKNKALIILISLLLIFSITYSLAAAEISFGEALSQGLDNNLEIREQQNTIASLERELKTIRAQQGWQIEVAANYNEVIDQGNLKDAAGVLDDTINTAAADGGNTSLSINRSFTSGLNISQEAVYNDQEESDYGVIISYPLFTGVPTETERTYYQQEQELLKEKNNLDSLIEEKISTWTENYLQIMRLKKSRENAELQLETARTSLAERKELYDNQQISKTELNNAEAELLDAKNSYSETRNQYQNTVKSLKLELGLGEESSIIIGDNQIRKKLEGELIDFKSYTFKELYQTMLNSDYDMQSALINLSLQQKQLEWFQNEGRTDINLSGSYNYSTEKSVIGVTFSYDLYDGGQREFNEENLKENLELAQDNLENLKVNKKITLESQLNTINSAQNNKKSAQLEYENAENQLDLAEAQYNAGIIDQKEFVQQQVDYQQSKNNLQQAEDKVLIAELDLTMLLNNNFKDIYNEVLNNDKND